MKMSRIREREVSTRLIRPTLHEIQLNQVLSMAANFDPQWEIDGKITVFDEGIAQFSLIDPTSHSKFYAALVLGKPSLRCTVIDSEPNDILEEESNIFNIIGIDRVSRTTEATNILNQLKDILGKRGYRFKD